MDVNPFTAPDCQISGLKSAHIKPADSIFDGPVAKPLSMLCILTEIFPPAHAKGQKSLDGFKFCTFIGRFQTDGAASTAVKGLSTI